ncbi:MAG: hypothetical protein U1A72_17050 [Sulfuritalea sp.]|nr:hypothetical protein [Sulfuritalea sp.]
MTAQAWQRKRGHPIEGPLAVAGAMLAGIVEDLPRLCLLHRRLAPEAPGRTRALLARLRAVREELSKIDLISDEVRETASILGAVRRKPKRR